MTKNIILLFTFVIIYVVSEQALKAGSSVSSYNKQQKEYAASKKYIIRGLSRLQYLSMKDPEDCSHQPTDCVEVKRLEITTLMEELYKKKDNYSAYAKLIHTTLHSRSNWFLAWAVHERTSDDLNPDFLLAQIIESDDLVALKHLKKSIVHFNNALPTV